MYRGNRIFRQTLPFLATLRELGIGYSFVTNNTSRGTEDYVTKLTAMGIEVEASQVFTPVASVVRYLRAQDKRTLVVLGTETLQMELQAAGFVLIDHDPNVMPNAVVVGFDTSLTYERLCHATYCIAMGATWVATHPDFVCPNNQHTILLDCGSICAAITAAIDQVPDVVLGKPDPAMLLDVAAHAGVPVSEIAVVGDRLYTDIAMANRAGAQSVLVFTGETLQSDLNNVEIDSELEPDLFYETLEDFGTLLRQ